MIRLGAVITVIVVALALSSGLQAQRYMITDLGLAPDGHYVSPSALNDDGVVVGECNQQPFRWSASDGIQLLGIPTGYTYAAASGINRIGQISVSTSKWTPNPNEYYGHAFRWTAGAWVDLGTLGGTYAKTYGIDDSGRVAGYAYTTSDIHAFRSTSTSLQDIDSLGGDYSLGYGISPSGWVVGEAYTASHKYHSFLWTGQGVMQDLGTMGGSQSEAKDISDNNEYIAGDSGNAQGQNHAYLWHDNNFTDLGSLGSSSHGDAVNNSGIVIGSYTVGNYGYPFVWNQSDGMKDLNDMMEPVTGGGWVLNYATDINNNGQIVGTGRHNGVVSGFLLTPVPEPATLTLLALGSLAILRRRSRK